MGKNKFHKHLILNFDLYIWDKDGTLLDYKNPKMELYPGLRRIIMQIPKQKQAMITNNGYPELFLKSEKIYKYFNPDLIFDGHGEIEKILSNKEHPYWEKFKLTGNWGKDEEIIYPQILKPNTYMFEKLLEKTKCNPSRCLMIGDSFEDIIPASMLGFKTIYLNGIENKSEEEPTVENLYLKPTYKIHIGDMKALENILFG